MTEQNIIVFTLEGCPHCDIILEYLDQRDHSYSKIHVPDDMSVEAFNILYPAATGFPHTTVNGKDVADLTFVLESGITI